MATYKKKGNKGEGKEARRSAKTVEVFENLDKGASRTEMWVARNQQYILGGIGVVVVVLLGYLAYRQWVLLPTEKTASTDLYYAQKHFEEALGNTEKQDSLYNLALEGHDGRYGLIDITEEYKGTDAANIANYSAGMAYLNMKKYKQAIAHLERFSSDDEMLGPMAAGGVGEAFSMLNQQEDALEYYLKAAEMKNNDYTTPRFLYKAGLAALAVNDRAQARACFKRIKDDFADSEEGKNIDGILGSVEN